MRILTAPINSLTWHDVIDFCSLQLPEGAAIDYKRELPSEIERTIASMANTSGGIVLIGVDEDRSTTRPITPISGLSPERGIAERITNLCISNITPPLVPEIVIVDDPGTKRVIAIVRVPQSHQAPHAISRNTRVYLRRGSVNSPEDLATLDELEWLKKGREKSISFRQSLYQRAEARFVQFLRGCDGSGNKNAPVERDGMLSIAFCPMYPKDMLLNPPDLSAIFRAIRVRDYYGTDHEFPLGSLNGVMVQDGFIVNASVNSGEWVHHTELNSFGLCFFKQSLLHPVQIEKQEYRIMRASEIFCRLDEMFDCAAKFFPQVGFNGWLHFRVRLENLVGSPFSKYSASEVGLDLSYTPDNSVEFEANLNSARLDEEKADVIFSAIRRVTWAFDWNVDRSFINKYYMRYKGKSVI